MSASKHKTVLLLNSSHGRFPVGSSAWVRGTIAAMDSFNASVHTLVTSIGLPGWELPAVAAARRGCRQKLILPGKNNSAGKRFFRRCLDDLGLDVNYTEPLFAGSGDFYSLRDNLAFELADTVFPVSVKPGGRLYKLLEQYNHAGGKVAKDFMVEYRNEDWLPRYNLQSGALNPELNELDSNWLTHWTHSHPGPWPDEPAASFYKDLLGNPGFYVRSAEATLARIVTDKKLRASSTHMAGSELTVSLTSLPPRQAIRSMRWRSRYRRWNMEPYGIAFRKQALIPYGAREVKYFDQIPESLKTAEKIFSQRRGRITDWSLEREWRIHGDLHLDGINTKDIVLIIFNKSSKTKLLFQKDSFRIIDILPGEV